MAIARTLPDLVRSKALVSGPACVRWLAELDDLVEALEDEWDIEVGATMTGGTTAFVAEAVTAQGQPAVVKIVMPAEPDGLAALANEVTVLVLADGRGCARALQHDVSRGAVLLERLGRQLLEARMPTEQAMVVMCSVLQHVWAIPYGDVPLPTLETKGPWLAELIADTWEALDRPCSRRAVDTARTYTERRLRELDPARARLLHGDVHVWNTLQDPTANGAYRLVDADGLIGEPEYDLAIMMREFTEELVQGDALTLGRRRAAFLAEHTGLDVQRIWEWGYIERLANALLSEADHPGSEPDLLAVAEQWSRAED
jgi:streptomycin 6-kinase